MKIGAEWAVSLIFIMICTITDIRKREIPLTMIILFSCLSLVIAKIRGEEGDGLASYILWRQECFFCC